MGTLATCSCRSVTFNLHSVPRTNDPIQLLRYLNLKRTKKGPSSLPTISVSNGSLSFRPFCTFSGLYTSNNSKDVDKSEDSVSSVSTASPDEEEDKSTDNNSPSNVSSPVL